MISNDQTNTHLRQDLRIIQDWVSPGSRILDLACGDGTLMTALRDKKNTSGYGMEISPTDINCCLSRGLNVIHRDIELGLSVFADKTFDYVLTTHSIQTLKNPAHILEEMVRVGVRGIVSFPNMGYWRARAHIAFKGKMPITKSLPFQWHDTPNTHLCTLRDFENLCKALQIKIERRAAVNDNHRRNFPAAAFPNLLSETALYEISAQNSG